MSAPAVEILAAPDVPTTDYADCRYRTVRKQVRRDIAEWLRAHGLPTAGPVWDAAWLGAVRDVDQLATLARESGTLPAYHDGPASPGALAPGDVLPGHAARVATEPLRDPETGAWWLTVRRVTTDAGPGDELADVTSALADLEIPAGARVYVRRGGRR